MEWGPCRPCLSLCWREQANDWNDDEVLERWTRLFKGAPLVQRYKAGNNVQFAELRFVKRMIDIYRQRLTDLEVPERVYRPGGEPGRRLHRAFL